MATAKLSNQVKSQAAKAQTSPELKQRLMFLILALLVYRVLAHVPVPGVNAAALAQSLQNSAGSGLFAMMNLFSGGAMSRASIIALGITPYISASIVMQLAGVVVPSLHALQKEGGAGRRKMTQYTRYLTLGLAIVQSYFIASQIQNMHGSGDAIVPNPGLGFVGVAMVS